MMVIVAVCGVGVWPCSFVVQAEASSLRLRGKAQGIGWFAGGLTSGVFGIVLPYMYNPDSGDLRGRIGFVFAALCFIGVVGTWRDIPEMKGRAMVEIDRMFEEKVPARKFVDWSSGESGSVSGDEESSR